MEERGAVEEKEMENRIRRKEAKVDEREEMGRWKKGVDGREGGDGEGRWDKWERREKIKLNQRKRNRQEREGDREKEKIRR